jgi:DNA-binding NarL/FixJ family response regulator
MMTPIRLFLVDGHEISRRGLRTLLARDTRCDVIGEARNGASALESMARVRPDVVMLELHDSGFSVVEWVTRLRAVDATARLVIVTAHEEPGAVRSAIDAGVVGYVLKRSSEGALRHAVDALLSMRVYVDPALGIYPDPAHHVAASMELSPREKEVVTKIALGHTSKEIAAEMLVSGKTVETYRYRASQKLGLINRADLVRYALDRGWMAPSLRAPVSSSPHPSPSQTVA